MEVLSNEMMYSISGVGLVDHVGGAVIAHDAVAVCNPVDSQEGNNEVGMQATICFPCTVCREGFDKKLLLNNHMKYKHGVNYVFTERGRKVKLVRLPEAVEDGGGQAKHVESAEDAEQRVFQVIETESQAIEEDDHNINVVNYGGGDENEGLGCGYAVNVTTAAYQKALVRKEVPFVGFFPVMSPHVYLLKVRDFGGVNQLLEPATKNDVVNAFLKHSRNGSVKTAGDVLPLVAFLHQVYNNDTGNLDISMTAPLCVEIDALKLISQDKFTNMAFANPPCDPAELARALEENGGGEIDDEEPIPLKMKPKGRGRGRGRWARSRSRSKSRNERSPPPPRAPSRQQRSHPTTPTPNQAPPTVILLPPTNSTPKSTLLALPAAAGSSSSPQPPPAKKPKQSRRPKAARAPKKIKDEPMEFVLWADEKGVIHTENGDVEIGMQEEEIPLQQTPSGGEKGGNNNQQENAMDEDDDKKFVQTPTCAPKKPPANNGGGPRRRGRPRKLKFEDCLDNEDAKMDIE